MVALSSAGSPTAIKAVGSLVYRLSCGLSGRMSSLAIASSLGLTPLLGSPEAATAQFAPSNPCRLPAEAIVEKETLRQAAVQGDAEAQAEYQRQIQLHATDLENCRRDNWPQNLALWLRLYSCDAYPGVLDEVLDRIVSRGYNEIYVEVFYDGQVLLPLNDNPTVWPSVVRSPQLGDRDLLAEVIRKGHERGLKVYAWVFTMNFGYSYGQRGDRVNAVARNGANETTLNRTRSEATAYDSELHSYASQTFIDPYSPEAQRDYELLLHAILERQPDGVLFDYVRYPRLPGGDSVASNVRQLWIHGEASRNALLDRARNDVARSLLDRYLQQGYLREAEIEQIRQEHPDDEQPRWQAVSRPAVSLQNYLWNLSVAHAVQGILDFVHGAVEQVNPHNIPSGAVFFPNGNQPVGEHGFDSRLQPWDRFLPSMEWHPMVYGVCGDTSCLTDQMERVMAFAAEETRVVPALAGVWGGSVTNRPSLETQMSAIRQVAPSVNSVSHFAYSWQFPESDRDRKACTIPRP
ncbi:MAG: family 10 glycosylhydrolase [Phormidium sp.]